MRNVRTVVNVKKKCAVCGYEIQAHHIGAKRRDARSIEMKSGKWLCGDCVDEVDETLRESP